MSATQSSFGPRGAEVALDEIGPAWRQRVGLGSAPWLATPLGALDPGLAASTVAPGSGVPARRHGAAPSTSAGSRRRSSSRRAVRGSARAAAHPRPPVAERSAAAPLVVGGHRHAQRLADRLDPEAVAVLVDVAAHFGRSGSSSLAKNTLADFRISFARRSSKFSCRSRLISSRSSLRWQIRAQARRLPQPAAPASATSRSWIPRSAATCAIGRPLSSASRTPRSSNSSGYFLGLDMTAEDLLSPGQHPGSKVPAKPGPAQIQVGAPFPWGRPLVLGRTCRPDS